MICEVVVFVHDDKICGVIIGLVEVEVMDDEASREQGLMNRRYLPADRGMLFDFHT